MWMVSHPWLIFLLQMVSHPGSIAKQFLNVNKDGVPSWSTFLLWMVSHPGQSSCCGWCPILVTAPELCKRRRGFLVMSLFMLQSSTMTILVTAPKLCKRNGWIFSYYLFFNLLLNWPVLDIYIYIYIVFCVLLIVLCFIMFFLSQDRSLGRCF